MSLIDGVREPSEYGSAYRYCFVDTTLASNCVRPASHDVNTRGQGRGNESPGGPRRSVALFTRPKWDVLDVTSRIVAKRLSLHERTRGGAAPRQQTRAMSSAKELAKKFENMAKASESPPPPVSNVRTPSAKALKAKFEAMNVSDDAPAPSPARATAASLTAPPPQVELPTEPLSAPPPAASAVPVAPVTFTLNAPPKSAPPPPSHGSLSAAATAAAAAAAEETPPAPPAAPLESSPPKASPMPVSAPVNAPVPEASIPVVPGSVFPAGQSAAAIAARSRATDEDDEDDGGSAVPSTTPSRISLPKAFTKGDAAVEPVPAPARKQTKVLSFGGAPKCPKCDKSVYHAERVVGLGGVDWHRGCLRCSSCDKTLGSVAEIADHKGDIFCKTCYGKLHGPKGVGFAGSGGTIFHST